MLNYTLDPYQPQYTPENFKVLWDARLARLQANATATAPPAEQLPANLGQLTVEEIEPLRARQTALLGCIVAVYQCLCQVYHTAIGLELGTNAGLALPPKPTHAAVVSDVGHRVDQFVRVAIVENAWRILHYGSISEIIATLRNVSQEGLVGHPDHQPGKAASEKMQRQFYFGAPSSEMEDRYRMPNILEPLRQYEKYLDGLPTSRSGSKTPHRIPTAIYPLPYPEALAIISDQGQEAVRFASELSPRIADIFCTI